MNKIIINPEKKIGRIKPMHAVNNGPLDKAGSQIRSNFNTFKAAGIPYVRNHDASFCSSYGGEHTVDVGFIFPNFDNDPYDENSYDFICTDAYLNIIEMAGSKVFYRLGSKIEHGVRKYGTLPPKDFYKWAVICEHIIRHYTEGWASGFHMDIEYWEIWNEPDLDDDDALDKRNWGGTTEEFYNLFAITARHLKKCFPHLKIGGPALSRKSVEWTEGFLQYLTSGERVPLDFLSWHIYTYYPERILEFSSYYRGVLDKYGYTETESILNEWNYVKDWGANFVDSIKTIISMKGAAFTAACMCLCQNDRGVDMLMYYDARPCVFNGMFDFYTLAPLKGYYPFVMFNKLYESGTQIECICEADNIYSVSAIDKSGKTTTMLVYYSDDENCVDKEIEIVYENASGRKIEQYLLDKTHNLELIKDYEISDVKLTIKHNTAVLLRECD